MPAGFWIILAATIAVYATMLFWSLPVITGDTGGLMPFDLRPGGYDLDEARAFLQALSPSGKAFYLETQLWLDSAYPALMAVTLVMAYQHLFARALAVPLSAVALLAAGFDYLENGAVARMISAEPDALTTEMVAAANRWTVLKSGASSLALIAFLAGLAWAGWRGWRRRAG